MGTSRDHVSALGAQVKRLRLAARLTQEQLAERGGVGQTLIGALESGRLRVIQRHQVPLLATALGVMPEYLVRLLPEPSDSRYRRVT